MIPLQTDGIGVWAHSWQGYPCFRERNKEDSCRMRDKRMSVCVCVCMCMTVCLTVLVEIDLVWSKKSTTC